MITSKESISTKFWFPAGLNRTVLGLIAATAVLDNALGDEVVQRSSVKDLKPEKAGLDATGLAITIFPASLISIFLIITTDYQSFLQHSLASEF